MPLRRVGFSAAQEPIRSGAKACCLVHRPRLVPAPAGLLRMRHIEFILATDQVLLPLA
jgi:hypothetical protein